MDIKIWASVFAIAFIAELGDKTQLATLLFAANKTTDRIAVLLGAGTALLLTSAIAVLAGAALANYINPKQLAIIAGIGFIAIGIGTLAKALGD